MVCIDPCIHGNNPGSCAICIALRNPVFHSMIPNAELEALRSDLAEALSLLRCASSNWKPGCCHQPEWDARLAALLAKHKETK